MCNEGSPGTPAARSREVADVARLGDYHIGEGGPLRRLERICRLTTLRRQLVVLVTAAWLPLVVLGIVSELFYGHRDPVLHDLSPHVRLLVASPIFLVLDAAFPRGIKLVLNQLVTQSFVPPSSLGRFDRLMRSAERWSSSPVPEVLLAFMSLALGVGALVGLVPMSGLARQAGLTVTQVWYVLTDWPLFQFLLWRALWRWVVWVRILAGLSRLDLDLVSTHPDRRGGIAFLRLPSLGYCTLLLFAISSVVCAEWRGNFTIEGASLATFKPLLLLFAILAGAIALGPLLLFVPKLLLARILGLQDFSGLAAHYGRRFRRHWLRGDDPDEVLGTKDTAPLAEMTTTYQSAAERLSAFLFYKRDVFILLGATLLPVLPLMLASVPHEDWVKLSGVVTGGF
jgi:hypothetical protein